MLNRRDFTGTLTLAAAASVAGCIGVSPNDPGLLDTHTHFYDPTRPQGVPWPPKDDRVLFRPIHPTEFVELSKPHGITGTIVVEASPWLEDNQWILDLAQANPCIRGFVGNIKPGRPEFAGALKRFARNPLFRGIRVGVWEPSSLAETSFLDDLRRLADLGLALDVLTAPDKLSEVAQLAATIPLLRIIVDHCANVRVAGGEPPASWQAGLRACAPHSNVFMKVSGLVEGTGRSDGTAPKEAVFYRPTLDAVWNAFGDDRVVFGSNWPVSARFASYETVFNLVNAYVRQRGLKSAQKYFSQNARYVYGLNPV